MSDSGERIAVLEQRADDSQAARDEFAKKVDAMAADIHDIKEKLSNWRGFVSGVTFAVATLAGLVGAGLTAVWHRLFQ